MYFAPLVRIGAWSMAPVLGQRIVLLFAGNLTSHRGLMEEVLSFAYLKSKAISC